MRWGRYMSAKFQVPCNCATDVAMGPPPPPPPLQLRLSLTPQLRPHYFHCSLAPPTLVLRCWLSGSRCTFLSR
jgi:hypothetical protein